MLTLPGIIEPCLQDVHFMTLSSVGCCFMIRYYFVSFLVHFLFFRGYPCLSVVNPYLKFLGCSPNSLADMIEN